MIYNLLIFIYLREKTFLLYGLFVLSMGFSMAFVNGIGQQYLWSYETFGIWQSQFTVGLYALTMTTAIAFSRSFLQLSHSFHKLDVVLLMILGVSFFIFIASFMTTADWVSQSSALIIMLGTSLLILAGILSHYAGHQSAKFFVLAFGTLCAGAFMSGLRSFDLIPTNMITANSVQLSSAIEPTGSNASKIRNATGAKGCEKNERTQTVSA
jgi:membrane-bound ClpP family serine protease